MRNSMILRLSLPFTTTLVFAATSFSHAAVPKPIDQMLRGFNHYEHEIKVFNKQGMNCSSCHTFSLNEANRELVPGQEFKKTTFVKSLKAICHECHRTAEAKHRDAPKACVICHNSARSMAVIAPPNHRNLEWKKVHATNARSDGSGCLDCHTSSQCVKCHMQRNDIELVNHSRNYRFFHSVDARMEPHRCDACHTRSYCVNCHTGANKK